MIMMMFGLVAVAIGPPVDRANDAHAGKCNDTRGRCPGPRPIHAQHAASPTQPRRPASTNSDLRYYGGKRVESRNTVARRTNPVTIGGITQQNRRFEIALFTRADRVPTERGRPGVRRPPIAAQISSDLSVILGSGNLRWAVRRKAPASHGKCTGCGVLLASSASCRSARLG